MQNLDFKTKRFKVHLVRGHHQANLRKHGHRKLQFQHSSTTLEYHRMTKCKKESSSFVHVMMKVVYEPTMQGMISMLPSPGGTDIKQVGERTPLPTWLRWCRTVIGRERHVWEINGVTGASREAQHADSLAMNIYSLAFLCEPSTSSPLRVWHMQPPLCVGVMTCMFNACV